MKHSKLALKLFTFLLLFVVFSVILPPTPFFVVAEQMRIERKTISSMSVFNENIKNQRLYLVALDHIEKNMDATSRIIEVKTLHDFDGNIYALFELSPFGYAIYHVLSGDFVEYSETANSPYFDKYGDLYYNGPKEYYSKEENYYNHTIVDDLQLTQVDILYKKQESRELSEKYCENILLDVKNYVDEGGEFLGVEKIGNTEYRINQHQARSNNAAISMNTFFGGLKTNYQLGYINTKACGYIAANMILGYCYFAYDSGLIKNSNFVDNVNKTMKGNGLTRLLISIDNKDPDTQLSGTTAYDIFQTVDKYLSDYISYQQLDWRISWRMGEVNARGAINDGFPVALFGNYKKPKSSERINHAMVAYEYEKYGALNAKIKYKVHFGWEDTEAIWITNPTVGTNFFMKIIE